MKPYDVSMDELRWAKLRDESYRVRITDAQLEVMADIRREIEGPGRPHENGGYVHPGCCSTSLLQADGSTYFSCTGPEGSIAVVIAPDGSFEPMDDPRVSNAQV